MNFAQWLTVFAYLVAAVAVWIVISDCEREP